MISPTVLSSSIISCMSSSPSRALNNSTMNFTGPPLCRVLFSNFSRHFDTNVSTSAWTFSSSLSKESTTTTFDLAAAAAFSASAFAAFCFCSCTSSESSFSKPEKRSPASLASLSSCCALIHAFWDLGLSFTSGSSAVFACGFGFVALALPVAPGELATWGLSSSLSESRPSSRLRCRSFSLICSSRFFSMSSASHSSSSSSSHPMASEKRGAFRP
mmetsp:Transcript_71959/g.116073  ORF Transcript_71959/g.116073 Transcript_71959/m.116073 type:complete len:216 (+) Transcript_71959:306-953(+)